MHHIKFNNEIVDLCANRHVVVATFREKLAVFDSCNFAARFHISFCYPTSPGAADPNPVALGDRWMAYADQRLLAVHRSLGGLETDSSQSMAAWGINVGSRLAQGVSRFYSNFFAGGASPSSSPSGRHHHHHQQPSPTTPGSGGGGSGPGSASGPQRGVVTVLDLLDVPNAEGDELPLADRIAGVVAHFIAHNKVDANSNAHLQDKPNFKHIFSGDCCYALRLNGEPAPDLRQRRKLLQPVPHLPLPRRGGLFDSTPSLLAVQGRHSRISAGWSFFLFIFWSAFCQLTNFSYI